MKTGIHFITFSCLLMFIFGYQNVDAQQNLAQEAYAIFEQSCLICHGENGSYTEALIIEHAALIDDGKVVPGDPDGSVFYQRLIETNVAKRMPQRQPPLDADAIETIRQWIAAGAPDWDTIPRSDTGFITTNAMLETIESHVNSLSSSDRSFARYFTLTHLYNAGETTEALNAYRRALSKLINSLSWGRDVVKPMPIDAEETLFYIDLRDYEWDVRNDAWTQIEQVYPYKMTFDAPTQTPLREKLTTLQQEMNCEVPFVHVDWFLATASLPPLYHDILALPETDRELEAVLRVFVTANLQNAPGERVWRAGFNDSGVSRHNRVVERHTSSYGAYWKSYDFAGSAESQNIFTHPLDFTHDGGEIIFNLPNGLQAYYLVDAGGNRLDVAPTSIVSNPAASDPAVRNGLSCIGCHTQGMKTVEDEVRAVVDQAANPPFDKVRALDLYVEKTVMDELVEEDTQRYRDALEAAGGVFGGIEPIQRFYEVFHGSLSAAHAAAAVGLETDVFLERINKNVSLQNLLGVLVLENGTVKRDAWTSNFHDVISVLNSPDSVLPPIVQRPEIIPGAGVYIPDPNLRAAIEEALGKAPNDVITAEDMATLTELNAVDADIQDLTGLQFATDLEILDIRRSPISDLSPLSALIKLRSLKFSSSAISDLSPLVRLENLEHLTAWGAEVLDLSPLKGLTKLRALEFDYDLLSDLSPLSGLSNLRWFVFYGCDVSDLSPLKELTELRHVQLSHNRISDISPLAGLVNLESLSIKDNEIVDISSLAGLFNLRDIRIGDNKISDVSPLASLHKLTFLEIERNSISDLSPLDELHQNTTIVWHGNPVFPKGGPKIEGPWLWVTVPGEGEHRRNLSRGRDLLAEASSGAVTEQQIATSSATIGKTVGDSVWTTGAINASDSNNVVHMLQELGMESPDFPNYVLYGSIALYSPQEQETTMYVGGDDDEKVWLNGKLIYHSPQRYLHSDYEAFFPVTLKKGGNVLLVATYNDGGAWSAYFGFETDTEYTLLPPSDIDIPDVNLRAAIVEALGKEDADSIPITLEDMATLTTLRASGKEIKDLTGLEFAKNLTDIYIPYNPLSDISPLASLTKLRQIQLSDTEVADLSPLAYLRDLEEINVSETRVSSLAPLAGLKNLQKLATVHSDISDLSPLAGLTNLTRLRLYDCKATDLSPLKNLTKLIWLGLTHTDHISDLSPLSGLTDLEHLALSDTEISDLSSLAGLFNLETLILNENRIVDVSPLASLRNLKNLQLHENNISDFSPLAGIRETIEVFTWFGNPAFPQGGPNIAGPWLWLTLPIIVDKDVDYLAKASNNKSAEQQVATLGASEGTVIGNSAWSVGMLEPFHPNDSKDNKTNLRRLLDSQDAIAPNIHGQKFVVYGSMTLYSPRIQQTKIFIGASVGQKIYLNGKLVHQDYTDYAFGAHNVGYRTFFPVTLQKGINVLLVRLDGLTAHNDLWSLFFGFEDGTEYSVILPDMVSRPSFSASETNVLTGDTFTLNLNAENITDLAGWQADIAFDPNVLEAVEVTEGDFLKSEGGGTFFQAGTIDNAAGKITSLYSARISESGVSGTGSLLSVTFMAKAGGETQVALENFEFISITDEIIPTVHPNITITVGEYPAWDVNQDGRVSIQDLILVARDLGSNAPTNLRTDVNRDGVINIQDLILVARHIGESTDSSAAPTIFAIDSEELMPEMIEAWIEQAQAADDGSLAFRQGIENLKRLLASLIPEKTALLANYPNPFNPETWIPYHLAKPADVTLTIYATNGSVVRTIALGHQVAGIYQSRNRAAYWNGRNAVGEPAASSI